MTYQCLGSSGNSVVHVHTTLWSSMICPRYGYRLQIAVARSYEMVNTPHEKTDFIAWAWPFLPEWPLPTICHWYRMETRTAAGTSLNRADNFNTHNKQHHPNEIQSVYPPGSDYYNQQGCKYLIIGPVGDNYVVPGSNKHCYCSGVTDKWQN